MQKFLVCICLAAASGLAWAQTAVPKPTFEMSDVHIAARAARPGSRGGVLRGDRWEMRNASMVDLIQLAYGVEAEKILGGPRWLEMSKFDVVARAPKGTPPDKVQLMLQAMLAERFALAVHEDKRDVPGFALVQGKAAHKLKKSDGSENGCKPKPVPKDAIGLNSLSCHNAPVDVLAQLLHDLGGSGYFNAPLINATGLEGKWDFDIQFTERNMLSRAGSDGINLLDAVEKQLGLKIEPRAVPTSVFVVDRANQQPTPNAPGVAAKLAPGKPREFEVATIKPNPAPVGQINVGIQGDGRLQANGVSLRQLVAIAWDVPPASIVGDPAQIDAHGFDVVAKAELDPISGLDIEEFRLMMRAMLIDRFQMKIGMAERVTPSYNLLAAKPKLTKADPANRASCKEGPVGASNQDARNKVASRNRLLTCRSVTMAEFADQLDVLVSGYVKAPVQDQTNLAGEWDFSINFSGINVYNAAIKAASAGGAAPDPDGAISLDDAVKEQLGLKLDPTKRNAQVLVVEKALENPTEN